MRLKGMQIANNPDHGLRPELRNGCPVLPMPIHAIAIELLLASVQLFTGALPLNISQE